MAIRYRGYYYDSESGLYYLQSRYYDPVTCRFISADGLLDSSRIIGFNLFSYCTNSPVQTKDPRGNLCGTIIGGIVGGVIGGLGGGVSAAINGKSIKAGLVTGAVTGAITGAICGFVADTGGLGAIAIGAMACSAVAVAGNITNQYWNYRIEKNQRTNSNRAQATRTPKKRRALTH